MRISFVLSSLRLSGGERVVVEFTNRLAQRGHTVYLIAPGQSVDLEHLPELVANVSILESAYPRREQPGILDHLRLALSLSRTVPACEVVVSTHTPTTVSAWLAARVWQRTRLLWLHQDYELMFANRPVERFLLRHAARWHDHVLAISDSIYEGVQQQKSAKVTLVGEGLSHAELFKPQAGHRTVEEGSKTILYVGDSRPRKGLADFLLASERVYDQGHDVRLLIVSKEPLQLQTCVPFEFVHRPTIVELADCYARCDLFVSASWGEGFGLPPLEAMACGAAVVLTDSGGVRAFARHEENCLMVPPRQPELLAKAIEHVLTDPALADRLRRNGPPTAAQFTWSAAVDRFEQAVLETLASP